MLFHNVRTALLSLTLAAAVAACGGQPQPQPDKPAEPPKAPAAQPPAPAPAQLTPLSVRLDWTANALHAPLYAALEKGYYKDAGLDVKINPATDKDDVLKLVDTGTDTLGLYYQSSVLKAPGKGYNVMAVGAYVQHALNVILVDQRAGVKSLKDLEGKTVGFTSDPQPKGGLSTTAAALKMMMEKAGADFSKVTLLGVGDTAVQALATQKVAAIGGVYEYHEKYLLDKEGIKTDVYRIHEHGGPDFYELVFVAGQKAVAEQGEAIKQFIAATEKGVKYAQQNPDEAADFVLKAAPTLKKDLVKVSLPVVLPLYADSKAAFGAQSKERWEAAAKWMVANKLLAEAPDLNKLLVK